MAHKCHLVWSGAELIKTLVGVEHLDTRGHSFHVKFIVPLVVYECVFTAIVKGRPFELWNSLCFSVNGRT